MTPAATLRPAAPADIPVLLALLRDMAEYERLLHRFTATHDGLAAALFGDVPLIHGALAEIDGEAVGFGIWSFSFHTFRCQRVLFVEDVFVSEARRGARIGYALFRHMAAEARAHGCERMEWRVLDWNELALRFYDRIGAETPVVRWVPRQLSGDALAVLAARTDPTQ